MIEIKNEYKNWTIGENDFQPEYLGKFETIFNLGKVFSCGLIITLVTWIFFKKEFCGFWYTSFYWNFNYFGLSFFKAPLQEFIN